MALPAGLTAMPPASSRQRRDRVWLLAFLSMAGLARADALTAETFHPLGPERVMEYRLQGTAVLDDGTIYGLSGSSSVTFGLPVTDPEGELVPVTTVTALEWEGISVTAADTLLRYMRFTGEGELIWETDGDLPPSVALPSPLAPGLSWTRVRDGSTDSLSVVSSGRNVAIPAGRFADCVGILTNRGGGTASSRSLEFLAPAVGRVMMVEELRSPAGWRIQLFHVLEEIRPS